MDPFKAPKLGKSDVVNMIRNSEIIDIKNDKPPIFRDKTFRTDITAKSIKIGNVNALANS